MRALIFCTTLFLLLMNITSSVEVLNIYINREPGNSRCDCIIDNNSSICCKSLDLAFENISLFDYTRFILSEGTHDLTQAPPPFQDLTSVTFEGNNSTVVCQQPLIGLAFINISNLFFYDIKFINCSAVRNSTSKRFDMENDYTDKFKVAIYFENSSNIFMEKVTISSSPNATGMVIYDAAGENTFKDCEFTNNSVNLFYEGHDIDEELGGGGGGVYVELTFCRPGKYCDFSETVINDASYKFINCKFRNNVASNWRKGGFIQPYKRNHQAFGRGGGLSLYLKGNNSNITFSVEGCIFESNIGLWGGGLFVELDDHVQGNNIFISSTEFINNSCPIERGGGGGGLRLVHYIYGSILTSNSFLVEDCTITGNWAINGGGLALSWAPQPNHTAEFALSNLQFENNWGRLGSALFIEQFWKLTRHKGLEASIDVINCIFFKNSDKFNEKIQEAKNSYELGIGAMYISSSSVNCNDTIIFENNEGSALAISDSNVVLEDCVANFTGNEGSTGAAIVLLGTSTMDVGKGTKILFKNNTALFHGGAIYAEFLSRQTRLTDPNCFIRYIDPFMDSNEWNITMVFINNRDHSGTKLNSIHATSILPCTDSIFDHAEGKSDTFCWSGWEYYENVEQYEQSNFSECENHISSDIGNIVVTNVDQHAIPGWQFPLPINVTDDLNAEFKTDDVFFSLNFKNDYPGSSEVHLCKKNVTILADPNSEMNIILTAAGDRVWSTDIKVTLDDCPPGFFYNDTERTCDCSKNYSIAVTCDDKTKKAKIAKNVWLDKIGIDSKYYISDCPYHYCSVRKEAYTNLSNDTEMCGNNREGIICGKCLDDFGPAVNSPDYECIECNNTENSVLLKNVLRYISVVYVPLAIFFTILIIFDIRLTTGPANAFILYSQVITTTFSLDANGGVPVDDVTNLTTNDVSVLMKLYKFPYDIFNLNFIASYIPSICFSREMDTLSVLCLEYGVAFFPLAMIVITIISLKLKDLCCSNRLNITSHSKIVIFIKERMGIINNSLLPAFAAFVLLSYTKFSTVSSNLMRTVQMKGDIRRMFLAGQYDENSQEYNAYMNTGIVMFVVFVAMTPILLLDFPLRALEYAISKSRILSRVYPITEIHILLDTFQGCYKKNARCFAGLYFLCRLFITLAYVNSETWVQRFVIQQITITVVIILLALFKPYRTELNFVNYVDILIFSNLAILNCLSFYLHVVYKSDPETASNEFTFIFCLQYIAVFIPLLYMVGYIIWHFKNKRNIKLKCEQLNTRDFDSVLLERAAETYSQPTSTDVSTEFIGTECDALVLRSNSQSSATSNLLTTNRSQSKRSYQALQLRGSLKQTKQDQHTKENSSCTHSGMI